MGECIFCDIASKSVESVVIWEDEDLLVFLDRCAVREGHTQIITKMHYETFEQTPPDVAAKMIHMGQRLARKFKSIYRVERVAFLFTGGDVAHVHAHVIPMHEKTDITSARYITNLDIVSFGSDHLMTDRLALESVRSKLGDI